jgi:hypothetical protein
VGLQNQKQQNSVDVGTASAGTFTLTVDGAETAGIAFNALASAVESAIEALSTVDDVVVSGVGSVGDPYLIEFDPAPSHRYASYAVSGDGAGLTGGPLTVALSQEAEFYSGRGSGPSPALSDSAPGRGATRDALNTRATAAKPGLDVEGYRAKIRRALGKRVAD